MRTYLLFLALLSTLLPIHTAEAVLMPFCFKWRWGKMHVIPCPKAPPPQDCDVGSQSCPCDPVVSSCPTYGSDESGLPFFAREAEKAGASCDLVEEEGIVMGDCSGFYAWFCEDDFCEDDLGNSWREIPEVAGRA